MTAGTYFFYVEHVSGGVCRVDYVQFRDKQSPVETKSWGSIKALYR